MQTLLFGEIYTLLVNLARFWKLLMTILVTDEVYTCGEGRVM